MPKVSNWSELQQGWRPLAASVWGTGAGLAGLVIYNLGLFANDLQSAFGLTRTEFGTAILALTVASALAMPLVGRLIDRFDARVPAVLSAAGLSLSFLALGTVTHSSTAYFVALIIMGGVSAASTAVSYSRVIATWFERKRGFALGITQAGIGLSSAIVPLFVARAIHDHGWQSGYLLLSAVSASSIPIVLIWLKARTDVTPTPVDRSPITFEGDLAFAAARRTPTYRLLLATMALMSITFFGLVLHFVPMLHDRRIDPRTAAAMASLIGVSIILSRLVIGWCSDRIHVRLLGPIVCGLSGLACLIIASGVEPLLPFAALMLGVAVGAESDLLGFLASRYFPLEIYGRVYARLYSVFILAAGASPAWIGWTYDHLGGYRPALIIVAALTVVMIALFRLMPDYPVLSDEATEHDPSKPPAGARRAEPLPAAE